MSTYAAARTSATLAGAEIDAPARAHAIVSRTVASCEVGMPGWIALPHGPLSATSIQVARTRRYSAFTPATTPSIDFFASPKSITVLGSSKSGLSIPAKPEFIERLSTTTLAALSTSRIGIP